MKVRTGRVRHACGIENDFRSATSGDWRVVHYPQAGGVETSVWVDGFGWCIDANEEMPREILAMLLEAVGAPCAG